jgi:hypothetical protein
MGSEQLMPNPLWNQRGVTVSHPDGQPKYILKHDHRQVNTKASTGELSVGEELRPNGSLN